MALTCAAAKVEVLAKDSSTVDSPDGIAENRDAVHDSRSVLSLDLCNDNRGGNAAVLFTDSDPGSGSGASVCGGAREEALSPGPLSILLCG